MTDAVDPQSVGARFRVSGEHSSLSPWRTFRWYKGQKHYSGSWWTVTEHDLVIYESRLGLAQLMYADFDVSVRHIVAQLFLLSVMVQGAGRKHIPTTYWRHRTASASNRRFRPRRSRSAISAAR
jgi:hypothetical protein